MPLSAWHQSDERWESGWEECYGRRARGNNAGPGTVPVSCAIRAPSLHSPSCGELSVRRELDPCHSHAGAGGRAGRGTLRGQLAREGPSTWRRDARRGGSTGSLRSADAMNGAPTSEFRLGCAGSAADADSRRSTRRPAGAVPGPERWLSRRGPSTRWPGAVARPSHALASCPPRALRVARKPDGRDLSQPCRPLWVVITMVS